MVFFQIIEFAQATKVKSQFIVVEINQKKA